MRNERNERHLRRAERGASLIEVMTAMAVMLIGASGVAGLTTMGLRLDGDGRKITRATAIAEDLASQITLWPFTDARLENRVSTNDDDVGDTGFALERTADPSALVDHGEADLIAGGATWHGIPSPLPADVASNGFQRFWNVSLNDPANPGTPLDSNGNATADGMRVAVIVRWPHGAGWRRIVVLVTKVNPAEINR